MQDLLSAPIVELLHSQTRVLSARLVDSGVDPQLAVVIVGDDPASHTYVNLKKRTAVSLGIIVSIYYLEEGTLLETVRETVQFLASDPEVHGLIIQLPLPSSLRAHTDELVSLIPVEKDVDGLSVAWESSSLPDPTIANFLENAGPALPPMIGSVISLLDHYHIPLHGKQVVLIGAGRLVGAPLQTYLGQIGVNVESVDEETPKILDRTKKADIVVTGTGQPELVTYQWVKEGVVVINASNDVHVDSVRQVAQAMSPAQGGVGPLTVAWLLYNTARAAGRQNA